MVETVHDEEWRVMGLSDDACQPAPLIALQPGLHELVLEQQGAVDAQLAPQFQGRDAVLGLG